MVLFSIGSIEYEFICVTDEYKLSIEHECEYSNLVVFDKNLFLDFPYPMATIRKVLELWGVRGDRNHNRTQSRFHFQI